MIDLHIHSEHSDGRDSVEKILQVAEQKKLKVISITDHFNVGAYEKLKKRSIRNLFSGKIIPGAEVGFNNGDGVAPELLAYGIDTDKIERASFADGKYQELPRYVTDYNYPPEHALASGSLETVSRRIRKAGGLVFVAHPFEVKDWFEYAVNNKLIDGVEAYYANQIPEATEELVEYCLRHGLYMSGGSDAHNADNIGKKKTLPKKALDAWIDKVHTI